MTVNTSLETKDYERTAAPLNAHLLISEHFSRDILQSWSLLSIVFAQKLLVLIMIPEIVTLLTGESVRWCRAQGITFTIDVVKPDRREKP